MKKLILTIGIVFLILIGCSNQNTEIKQNVSYDNVLNNYSVTTTFTYPNYYNSCVYIYSEGKIDSIKVAEMNKAKHVQMVMILKAN